MSKIPKHTAAFIWDGEVWGLRVIENDKKELWEYIHSFEDESDKFVFSFKFPVKRSYLEQQIGKLLLKERWVDKVLCIESNTDTILGLFSISEEPFEDEEEEEDDDGYEVSIQAIETLEFKEKDFKKEKRKTKPIEFKNGPEKVKYFRYDEDLDAFEEYQPDVEKLQEMQKTLEDALSETKEKIIQNPAASFEQKKKALQKDIVVMKPETAKEIIKWCAIIFVLALVCFGVAKLVTTVQENIEKNEVRKMIQQEQDRRSVLPQVEVIDFSKMDKKQIHEWANKNNVEVVILDLESDTVPKGEIIEQFPEPGKFVVIGENKIFIKFSKGKKGEYREMEAQEKGLQYAVEVVLSKQGTYDQLIYDGYTPEEAQYAVDNIDIDWKMNAWEKARLYSNKKNFSKQRTYDQLIYEKYTPEEAQNAVDIEYR